MRYTNAYCPSTLPEKISINNPQTNPTTIPAFYLTSLHDEDLLQRPENCEWTRFTLILAQYRHLYMHMGMLMGFVQAETGLCPRTLQVGQDLPRPPYDPYE